MTRYYIATMLVAVLSAGVSSAAEIEWDRQEGSGDASRLVRTLKTAVQNDVSAPPAKVGRVMDGKDVDCATPGDAALGRGKYALSAPQAILEPGSGSIKIALKAEFAQCVIGAKGQPQWLAVPPAAPFSYKLPKLGGGEISVEVSHKDYRLVVTAPGKVEPVAVTRFEQKDGGHGVRFSVALSDVLSDAQRTSLDVGANVPLRLELVAHSHVHHAVDGGAPVSQGDMAGAAYVLNVDLRKSNGKLTADRTTLASLANAVRR